MALARPEPWLRLAQCAAAVMVAAVLAVPDAGAQDIMADAPGVKVEVPGQIILNPEPSDPSVPAAAQELHDALTGDALAAAPLGDLAPAAGGNVIGSAPAGAVPSDCTGDDGWQVVIVRGSDRAETVRGRLIAVTPRAC